MEVPKNLIERWNRHDTKDETARRRRRKLITLGIIAVICLAIVLSTIYLGTDIIVKPATDLTVVSKSGEWAMLGRDLTHSGVTGQTSTIPQGTVKSILTAGAGMRSSPVIAGGVIYVGSRDSNFYAIDQATGNKLWTFKTGSWVESSPAVVNNIVYFGSNDGNLYALNAATGAKLWAFNVKYPVQSSPTVVDGKVYFGADDYSMYALDAVTGEKVWSKSTRDTISSSPVIANGIVYFGSIDGNFYALDARNGRQRLAFPSNRMIVASPAVVDTTVYVNTSDGTLYAFNGESKNWFGESKIRPIWMLLHIYGDLPSPPLPSGYLWSLNTKGFTGSSPTISGNNLYVGSGSKVLSVSLTDHTAKWEYNTGSVVSWAGILNNDTVYTVTEGGHLYLLKADTGEKIKDIAIGGGIYSVPLVVNGTVYISSDDGNLYAVN